MDGEAARSKAMALPEGVWSAGGPALFVWAAWGLMVGSSLVLISRYGSPVPWYDDWDTVPLLTGHTPLTAAVLWHPHNEHRIPLALLVQLGLAKLTHCDFRAGMFASFLLLAAASALLIRAAQQVRGRLVYEDAFLALAMLGPGHWNTLLWSFQLVFALSTFLAASVVAVIVSSAGRPAAIQLVWAAACIVLLPLCGAQGESMAPMLGCWLIGIGFTSWRHRTRQQRLLGVLGWGGGVATFALVAFYRFGLHYLHGPPAPGLAAIALTALQFATIGLGQAADKQWGWTGYVIAGGMILGAVQLVNVYRNEKQSRPAVLGLSAVLGAFSMLALVIGYGRSGCQATPPAGLASRYVTLSAPFLCAFYFVWTIGRPRPIAQCVQMCFLSLACLVCLPNFQEAFATAKMVHANLGAFERELRAGGDPMELARRYPAVYPYPTWSGLCIPMLRDSGNRCFRVPVQQASR